MLAYQLSRLKAPLLGIQLDFQMDSAVTAAIFYHFRGTQTPSSNMQRDAAYTPTNLGLKRQRQGLI